MQVFDPLLSGEVDAADSHGDMVVQFVAIDAGRMP